MIIAALHWSNHLRLERIIAASHVIVNIIIIQGWKQSDDAIVKQEKVALKSQRKENHTALNENQIAFFLGTFRRLKLGLR